MSFRLLRALSFFCSCGLQLQRKTNLYVVAFDIKTLVELLLHGERQRLRPVLRGLSQSKSAASSLWVDIKKLFQEAGAFLGKLLNCSSKWFPLVISGVCLQYRWTPWWSYLLRFRLLCIWRPAVSTPHGKPLSTGPHFQHVTVIIERKLCEVCNRHML